jgi:hypothetical protein
MPALIDVGPRLCSILDYRLSRTPLPGTWVNSTQTVDKYSNYTSLRLLASRYVASVIASAVLNRVNSSR